MGAVERLLAAARAEIGYLEKESNSQLESPSANAGDNNWNKYARDLDAHGIVYNGKKNGYAWCDIFVDWCFISVFGVDVGMDMTFQPDKGCGAGCTWSARYYRENGKFHEDNPQPGDQIFFTNDGGKTSYHTGIVEKVSGGRVYTIEGNTSSLPGVVENGGCVRDKSYPLGASYIMGYGTPDWALVAEEEKEMPFTQADFDKMMDNWLARREQKDPADWSEEARKWAEENGIIYGDGSGKKMYKAFATREHMIVFLYRLAEKLGLVK